MAIAEIRRHGNDRPPQSRTYEPDGAECILLLPLHAQSIQLPLTMTELSEIGVHAGGLECIRFQKLGANQLAELISEFGADGCATPQRDAKPLVGVRFEPVAPPTEAIYVGRNNAVSGEVFYSGEGVHWASIRLADLLDPSADFEVVASPGYDMVRLVGYILEPLAKVRALLRGHCFIHSSAIGFNGRAILLCAWGNTGKTNLLLHFSRGGSQILSDDWSLLLADGTVAGYPRPVNLMNYNLDAFPYLLPCLSWKQRSLYRVDRLFRCARPTLASRGGILMRLTDGIERILEMAANCRLPLGNFPSSSDATLSPAAIIEIHKLERGATACVDRLPIGDAARMATICFGFECGRLMQRLAEYAYVNPRYDNLAAEILSLYARTLQANLAKASGATIYSIGMPSRPSPDELAQVAKEIQLLCVQ